MKTKIFTLALALFAQIIFAQITGTWFTSLEIQGQKLPLVLHIDNGGTSYKSTFDSPMQGAKGIPIEKTTFTGNDFSFSAPNLNMSFEGKFSGEKIEGIFKQNGMQIPMVFTKNEEVAKISRPQTPKPPYNYDNEEVTLKNEMQGNVLAGTISSPKNFDKSKPILVMITGSGAQNRDEELFGHKTFLVIADDFAKKGIATLRMDDRGIGSSEKGKDGATSLDFAGDISSAVNFLAKKGYKNIGLIGHSEGGMIAPIVANMNKNVKFLVLLAGPGEPITDLMVRQNNMQGKFAGATDEQINANAITNKKIFDFINNYKGQNLQKDTEKFMIKELTKSHKEMNAEEMQKMATSQAKSVASPWFRYFIKFMPENYMSKVKIPVLAINGSLDSQVSAKENLEAIKKSLTKAGNKNFKTVEIPGLNHLFQTAKTGSPEEYSKIEETFSPVALKIISGWILNLKT